MKKLLLVLAILICTIVNAQYSMLNDFSSNGAFSGAYPQHDQNLVSDGTFLYGMTAQGGTKSMGTIFKIMPNGTGFIKLIDFSGIASGNTPVGSLLFDGTFLYGMTSMGGINNKGTIFKIMPDGTGFVKLMDFSGFTDGSSPQGSLIFDGTFLYGMTSAGGINNMGTIFKIMPDGTGYIKLMDFSGVADGRVPQGSLIFDGTFLYGMTSAGGTNDKGTVFKIMPDGSGFVRLMSFLNAISGSSPLGSLVFDGTFLYGMTSAGGSINNMGTIFKIMPDGTGYVKLMTFSGVSNGSGPQGSLITDGTFLYGMTAGGGTNNMGTFFKIMPNGTGYAKLLDFAGILNGSGPQGNLFSDGTFFYSMTNLGGTNNIGTMFKIMPSGSGYTKLIDFTGNINGQRPFGSFISDGIFLYGMTVEGGTNNMGTIYKIKPDGTSYTKLMDFNGATNGSNPHTSLISHDTVLYGATTFGGVNNQGTVFKINPDGTGFVKLIDFAGASNGRYPNGSLIFDGTFLYGITNGGGTNDNGTIYKIMPDGTNYAKLMDFSGIADGGGPSSNLFFDGNFLYGMTAGGGTNNMGTIYKIMPNGTGFVKLMDFAGASNGRSPQGSLIFDGTFLYGMTSWGGLNDMGTAFKIMPDGTGYVKLMDFNGSSNGNRPDFSFIFDGTLLYGVTSRGGINDKGTLFKIMPDGTGYNKLLDLDSISNGNAPNGSLFSDGIYLYGVTWEGGTASVGTIFKYQYCNPVTITATSTNVCTGSSIILTANGAPSYTWSAGVTNNLAFIPTSTNSYSVTGSGSGVCSNTSTISVIVNNACANVWPGDANCDGIADNLDVLELGLHYTQTGAPRASTSNNWQSYFANNWTGTITNGKNLNHSDCNGDGTINDNDTLAIYNNYGLTHAFKPVQTNTVNPQLSIVPDQAFVAKGSWGTASIYVGDATTNINNINGVAFTIDFDNTLIETNNIYIEYQNSFIDAGQNLHFRKQDFANGKIFTATTHTINNNVSGFGKIATLHYQIKSTLTSVQVLNLGISQANQSDASGLISLLTSGTGSLAATIDVGLQEFLNSNLISISPNPTNGLLTINSKTELHKIEVISITGQVLLSETPTNVSHTLHLDNFSNGIYFVNVFQNNRVVKREKIVLNK